MEITIFEGGRGTGKSTLASKFRQKNSDTTLINFTGFHEDGQSGLSKVTEYYKSWMQLLFALSGHKSSMVFDRFYFSERVYSQLYKDYDFRGHFFEFNESLDELAQMGVKINIVLLTIHDKEELKQRLMRDKVPFGKAEENVSETLKQQDEYINVMAGFNISYNGDNMKVYQIDTSGKSNDEVYVEVLEKLKPLN